MSPASAGLPATLDQVRSAAWLDADHDGDLDLMIGGTPRLDCFATTEKACSRTSPRPRGSATRRRSPPLVPTDYDNRRDIDVLAGRRRAPASLPQHARRHLQGRLR